jgi:hypothetical protein
MDADTINALITLATAAGQLGLAAAAYKLALALKTKVDNHESRIVVLERKVA